MPRYTHRQQLISTKTIAKIAKQVHEDEEDKLIKRNYLFGVYNPRTNIWANLPAPPFIYWENGRIVCLSDFRIMDNATVLNAPVPDDPDTMKDEAVQQAQDGPNVIAPITQLQSGKRLSDTIKIHAVSALVRLKVNYIQQELGNVLIPAYTDSVQFRYGFYTYRKVDPNGVFNNAQVPNIFSLTKWKPFGYSAQLDNLTANINNAGIPYATRNLKMLLENEKITTLSKGKTNVRISGFNSFPNVKTVRIYHKLKKPIEIMYHPDNQSGSDVLNQKLYFAIQSDVSQTLGQSIFPEAQVCTKLHYTNVL